MRQNATGAEKTLTPAQERALAALLTGKTVTAAADDAQVDRTTVHRWLKDDFVFQAALNRGRRDLYEALRVRLMTLADKAVECLERSLAEGDGKTALEVLKGLGMLPGKAQNVGSDDPEDLAGDARRADVLRGMLG
jgi:hypothetical protein